MQGLQNKIEDPPYAPNHNKAAIPELEYLEGATIDPSKTNPRFVATQRCNPALLNGYTAFRWNNYLPTEFLPSQKEEKMVTILYLRRIYLFAQQRL